MIYSLIAIVSILILSAYREWAFYRESKMLMSERRDLLDRIQAPSFAEYTNKVVREKKAEQPKEEEKPIEFIS